MDTSTTSRIDEIEKLGASILEDCNNDREHTIVDSYNSWRVKAEDLFNEYYDESNAHYKDFISYPRGGNGYVLSGRFSVQYPISQSLLLKIKNKMSKKMSVPNISVAGREIFISHASHDKETIIDPLLDLITSTLAVTIDQIFCSTTDGTKIESGEDWRNAIRENLTSAKINLVIVTPYYKESEVCQNEMGAGWVCSSKVTPFIVEPINYGSVGIIQKPLQIEKLLDETSLDRLKDIIQHQLGIDPKKIKSDRWTIKKKEFIQKVKANLKKKPFPPAMDRVIYESNIKIIRALRSSIQKLEDESKASKELIKELESLKDKGAVLKTKDKFKKVETSEDDNIIFKRLVSDFKKELKGMRPFIVGLVFIDFTRKEIATTAMNHTDDISDAVGDGLVDDELNLIHSSRKIKKLSSIYTELSAFLNTDLSDEFQEEFENDYKCELELGNKGFWEEVFEVSVRFN